MADERNEEARGDALLPRLKLIEDQPLESRAAAYAHLHDELREALDAADRQGGR
ncbi:hypothetical protein [Gryllotalpicola daejeonensis]|uniref:hypothetical protein n=1 Tax=Gryllotalpicola daejeonensis TaxID=993087 RepID=UPI0031D4F3FD